MSVFGQRGTLQEDLLFVCAISIEKKKAIRLRPDKGFPTFSQKRMSRPGNKGKAYSANQQPLGKLFKSRSLDSQF